MRRPFLIALASLAAVTALLLVAAVRGQGSTSVSLLVVGGPVVTMNVARDVIPMGAVAIDADKIVAVGPADDLSRRYTGRVRVDVHGQLILPGLINTHT